MPKSELLMCPQCKGSFEQRLVCPRCGIRLEAPDRPRHAPTDVASPPTSWLNLPLGRMAIGLVLAQGLYLGLWQLCKSILIVTAGQEASNWEKLAPLVVLQG